MPGTTTSMPKRGSPVTILALSTPGVGWPMILKLFGSLSVTLARSGGDSKAAFDASSP